MATTTKYFIIFILFFTFFTKDSFTSPLCYKNALAPITKTAEDDTSKVEMLKALKETTDDKITKSILEEIFLELGMSLKTPLVKKTYSNDFLTKDFLKDFDISETELEKLRGESEKNLPFRALYYTEKDNKLSAISIVIDWEHQYNGQRLGYEIWYTQALEPSLGRRLNYKISQDFQKGYLGTDENFGFAKYLGISIVQIPKWHYFHKTLGFRGSDDWYTLSTTANFSQIINEKLQKLDDELTSDNLETFMKQATRSWKRDYDFYSEHSVVFINHIIDKMAELKLIPELPSPEFDSPLTSA